MTVPGRRVTVTIDDLDRQILHCLVLDGRASYARIAEVLEVSEQTVARRYARLVHEGVARVLVARNTVAAGESDWFVRLRCRPDGLEAVTAALARRDDAAWVAITSGGSEVVCAIRPPLHGDDLGADGGAVLLDRLPRSSAVLAMQAVMLVRKFDSDTSEWTAFSPGLPAGAEQALLAGRGRRTPNEVTADADLPLRPDDGPLLDLLARDGRATHRALAAATGWSESRVARRVADLLGSGAVDVDVDVSVDALGFRTFAYLWVTAAPGRVEALGWELARLPQVAFVGAVTGTAPLLVIVLCRTPEELYGVVTGAVGGLAGVTAVDVAPVSRRVKQGGTIVERGRLALPGRV
ncbi:Lrp/AsnC family transcriptional regulator [Jatrophihabitans sp. YIM 134969]